MAEIIRPPEFNKPNLRSLLEEADNLFREIDISPPEKITTSQLNVEVVKEEKVEEVTRHLEHHIDMFRRAVENNPDKIQEISGRSSMLWLYLDRAKKILAGED